MHGRIANQVEAFRIRMALPPLAAESDFTDLQPCFAQFSKLYRRRSLHKFFLNRVYHTRVKTTIEGIPKNGSRFSSRFPPRRQRLSRAGAGVLPIRRDGKRTNRRRTWFRAAALRREGCGRARSRGQMFSGWYTSPRVRRPPRIALSRPQPVVPHRGRRFIAFLSISLTALCIVLFS